MSDTERLRGLEQYKELLQHVMEVYPNKIVFKVTTSPQWIYPSMPEWVTNGGTANAPLTSTSWDGDAHSTEAKTLLDLSAVFGVPAGVKAVDVYVSVLDSASSTSDTYIILSSNDTSGSGKRAWPQPVNSRAGRFSFVVPCNADGDIYTQIVASGAGTFLATIQIMGYYI